MRYKPKRHKWAVWMNDEDDPEATLIEASSLSVAKAIYAKSRKVLNLYRQKPDVVGGCAWEKRHDFYTTQEPQAVD